jgi:integrase
MTTSLTQTHVMSRAAQVANLHASRNAFIDYRSRKARNTIAAQDAALKAFKQFLASANIGTGDLSLDPEAWRGVTFGIVEAFIKWQLQQGYSIGTINLRLTAVKVYARLAFKAGVIDVADHALIRSVQGYGHKEGKRVDAGRDVARVGSKKAESVSLTAEQAERLKAQPNTPQGRRDALMLCLLIDLGLRAGEVVELKTKDVNLKAGVITFHRPKVDKIQTHKMINGLHEAMRRYFAAGDAPKTGPLIRASRKGGKLAAHGMTRFGIAKRVQELGAVVGLDHLSPHDLRHYWATQAARNGTQVDRLQDAGGWNSPAMPLRYVEKAAIANEGVKLSA